VPMIGNLGSPARIKADRDLREALPALPSCDRLGASHFAHRFGPQALGDLRKDRALRIGRRPSESRVGFAELLELGGKSSLLGELGFQQLA